ncbi:MAG: YbbR-like domain-containing protein [Tannerella sp.]|jgi:YbbR domain-containing protein|nr:YbbR-like domain-containing protein [Tannerella sp.]
MARLDISLFFKSVFRKIRAFFLRQKWEEILIFFCFVLLSTGFWYLESLQEEYEIEVGMPVKYKNVPQDVVLSADNPQSLLIRIRDKGTVLINYLWFNSFSPIEVDMKDVLSGKRSEAVAERRLLESAISRQLIASTSLLSIDPPTIRVDYTELIHKDITVSADVDIQTDPGFQISDAIRINPTKVHVYAESAILDTLLVIETESIELKRANKTVTHTVRLKPIPNARMEPEKVEVTIPIEEFTEKRFQIPVECKNLPDNYDLRVFPSTVEVVCNIPMSKYKDLERSDIEIRMSFQEFDSNRVSGGLPVRLTKCPEWLVTPLVNPYTVEFILEQKNP